MLIHQRLKPGNFQSSDLYHKTITTANQILPCGQDGDTVIQYYRIPVTVTSDAVFTTGARCKGLVLFIEGNLVVDGTISMTGRGACAPGDNLAIDYLNKKLLVNPDNWSSYEYTIAANGGDGAAAFNGPPNVVDGTYYTNGNNGGSAGSTYACGGGGNGGIAVWRTQSTGPSSGSMITGGSGTSYSGGVGTGGACNVYTTTAHNNFALGINCGVGGEGNAQGSNWASVISGAGGGAGNPGGLGHYVKPLYAPVCSGASNSAFTGASGTGGLLIIVVYGDITITETGVISSDGLHGGNTFCTAGAGGGGSGGGSINILHTGSFTNNGTIHANGGPGGTGNAVGGTGGTGTIRIAQISL